MRTGQCPFHGNAIEHSKPKITYDSYLDILKLEQLGHPTTDLLGERLFINVHLICELLFGLIIRQVDEFALQPNLEDTTPSRWIEVATRLRNYYLVLTKTMSLLVTNFSKDEFMPFRSNLEPASGFQSLNYRIIELKFTHLDNLAVKEERQNLQGLSVEEKLQKLYWIKEQETWSY